MKITDTRATIETKPSMEGSGTTMAVMLKVPILVPFVAKPSQQVTPPDIRTLPVMLSSFEAPLKEMLAFPRSAK